MMVDEPDSENSLFSEPMKDAHAVGALGAAEQVDDALLGLEIVEQEPHPLQVLQRVQVSSRLAWPRTMSWRSSLAPPDQTAMPARDHLLWVSWSSSLRPCASAASSSARTSAACGRGCAR